MTDNIPWEKIRVVGQETMLKSHIFNVSWILARYCNYSCSYCWPYARSSVLDHQPTESYFSTLDSIKAQSRANGFNKFHFSFSGGEPTAFKKLPDLIRACTEDDVAEYQSVHLTTNLSPASTWWDRWADLTKPLDRRSITASYHAEFAAKHEFAYKCKGLMEQGVLLTVNQVMVPEHFDEYYELVQFLQAEGIHVTMKPQSDQTASYIVGGYSDKQLEIMRRSYTEEIIEAPQFRLEDVDGNAYMLNQAEGLNAFGFNKFKGWECNAGYQSCVIRSNEVKRAYSCHEQPLGTMTEGFELFKKPQLCVTPTCVSSADSKIPKRKI
jgi:MoaA/NifB/PqqE/SkfB family radical SAM enzyme